MYSLFLNGSSNCESCYHVQVQDEAVLKLNGHGSIRVNASTVATGPSQKSHCKLVKSVSFIAQLHELEAESSKATQTGICGQS